MSILAELVSSVVDLAFDQAEKELRRARHAINRRIGRVPAGRAPLDEKLHAAKRRVILELDELEPPVDRDTLRPPGDS